MHSWHPGTRTPDRAAIVALDKRHVWHPYTPMKRYVEEVDPFVIAHASGPFLHDVDGRRYFDANSSWWVAALGHGHPRLVEALVEQARSMCHVSLAGTTHAPAAELAKALVDVAPPGLERVFYSDDGSTALEAALKMALGYHAHRGEPGRSRFVALGGAFHGETLGVVALGGVPLFRRAYAGALMEAYFCEPPPLDEPEDGPSYLAVERLVRERAAELAGIVVEPLLQGATGMRLHAPAFLRHLREIADEHGLLLIADEVFTGYGRTGTMWAIEQAGVRPDLLCTAKGFSGGVLPMAATLATDAVYQAFYDAPEKTFFHGHSFCGNPLGARVALEVLAVMRDEGVLEGIAERSARIRASFERMGQHAATTNPRAIGMVGAIDLVDPRAREATEEPSEGDDDEKVPWSERPGYLGQAGWRVHEAARQRGVYLRPLGDVVYVAPPLNIGLAELDELLGLVEESLRVALAAS